MQAREHEEEPVPEAVEIVEVPQMPVLRDDLLPGRDRRCRREDAGHAAVPVEQDPALTLQVRAEARPAMQMSRERFRRVVAQRDAAVLEISWNGAAHIAQSRSSGASQDEDVEIARLRVGAARDRPEETHALHSGQLLEMLGEGHGAFAQRRHRQRGCGAQRRLHARSRGVEPGAGRRRRFGLRPDSSCGHRTGGTVGRVLLTITTTHRPATDLGYLLHKRPDRVQTFTVPFGEAHVFYPEASEERCTAALLLDIDPVGLVRRGRGAASFALAEYVNDRPYVASSFLSVALVNVFKSAMEAPL